MEGQMKPGAAIEKKKLDVISDRIVQVKNSLYDINARFTKLHDRLFGSGPQDDLVENPPKPTGVLLQLENDIADLNRVVDSLHTNISKFEELA